MEADVLTLRQINRVVHRHDWADLDEWVTGIARLADLSDQDLEDIERMTRDETARAASRL